MLRMSHAKRFECLILYKQFRKEWRAIFTVYSFHHCKNHLSPRSPVSFIIDHRRPSGWMAGVDCATPKISTTSPFKVVILSLAVYQRIRDAPGFTDERFDELNIRPLSLMHSRRVMGKPYDAPSHGITGFQADANEMSYCI